MPAPVKLARATQLPDNWTWRRCFADLWTLPSSRSGQLEKRTEGTNRMHELEGHSTLSSHLAVNSFRALQPETSLLD